MGLIWDMGLMTTGQAACYSNSVKRMINNTYTYGGSHEHRYIPNRTEVTDQREHVNDRDADRHTNYYSEYKCTTRHSHLDPV